MCSLLVCRQDDGGWTSRQVPRPVIVYVQSTNKYFTDNFFRAQVCHLCTCTPG
jgi:hypothetical protein